MKARFSIWIALALAVLAVMGAVACAKKAAHVAAVTPPPPPAEPTATLTATPSSLQKGESTELVWKTENATDITLEGIGTVNANGSQQVTPADSTTYRLIAKGPGGTQEAAARVTVTIPPPPPPPVAQVTEEELFAQKVRDVFFDFDKHNLRTEAQEMLDSSALFLQQHPEIKLLITGHCDERGSEEYNLGLGSNRADAAKTALVNAGIAADRIRTVSYGKEKPFCTESNEECWQLNRRAHFVLDR